MARHPRRVIRWIAAIAGCAALTLGSTAAFAHHSGAMFDLTRKVVIRGTIIDFNWTNPHTNFSVRVPNKDGTTSVWSIEMNSPNNLIRVGWRRNTLKPGDKVTVTVRPLRDGTPGGQYVSIVLPGGKALGGEQQRAGEK